MLPPPDLGTHPLILGGDLDCWIDPQLDCFASKPAAVHKSANCILSFSEYGISDVWFFLHARDRQCSFYLSFYHTYTRTVYFYLFFDNKLILQVRSCESQSIVISDHALLVLGLSFTCVGLAKRH